LFNGLGGEFRAQILSVERRGVRVRIGMHEAIERESPVRLTLLQSITRGEKMDFVIQKATELGVGAIVAFSAERSVVRLDDEAHRKRREHWRAIAVSACEQCGRNRIPVVELAENLAAAMTRTDADECRLVLDPDAEQPLSMLPARASSIAVLVGPEGGFGVDELALAHDRGFIARRLGPRVLRADTAPLAALAVIQSLIGDLGV
jgi:16S rRNA (uracil1498-N3)-methyltransferase